MTVNVCGTKEHKKIFTKQSWLENESSSINFFGCKIKWAFIMMWLDARSFNTRGFLRFHVQDFFSLRMSTLIKHTENGPLKIPLKGPSIQFSLLPGEKIDGFLREVEDVY